jgi:sulfur transfer protein SufE
MNALEEIQELFLATTSWVDRYNYIVELSARLPAMPEHLATPENRVDCTSTLYFCALASNHLLHVHARANAAIPAGLAALLVDTFDGIPLADAPRRLTALAAFLHPSGLLDNLTPPRATALRRMIARVDSCINFI